MIRVLYILLLLGFLTTFVNAQDEFFEPKTTIGGYGELHYNWSKPDGSDNAAKVLDFHRFVMFFAHTWSEKWSFKSELELEHNFVEGGEEKGELELEQAYVDYHHSNAFGFQVGVLLPSAGFINEYHEPPLFLSVERPDYAKSIIPTTWFGNGAAIYGRLSDFSYKLVVMEGFNGDKFSAKNGLRSGRQKGFKSNADEFLYNGRIDYRGLRGLWIGGSFSFNDAITTSDTTISTSIFEFHAKYNANNFLGTFEFGNVSYDGKDVGLALETSKGYYFDLGYNIADLLKIKGKLLPWFRFTDYNTAASVIGGGDEEERFHFKKWMIGLAFRPIDPVVFKLDYGIKTRQLDDADEKLFNIGAGYMF